MSRPETKSKDNADVVIIGGGVIGLSIARALRQRGAGDVLLIERSTTLGAEASHAAGGILGPQAEADCADDFFKLACTSRDLYRDFAAALLEETGIDIELDTTGTLYLAFNQSDEAELDRRYLWQTRTGLAVERLSGAEARRLERSVPETAGGALRFPADNQVENRRLIAALIAAGER